MKIYGLSVDQQFAIVRRLSSQLEKLVREVEEQPSRSLLIEAELTAACAQDHLRDMTIWLRGSRETFDRVASANETTDAESNSHVARA